MYEDGESSVLENKGVKKRIQNVDFTCEDYLILIK